MGAQVGVSPGLFGVVGWKNAGKTCLVERLIASFVADGRRVSTIKHTHHDIDLDTQGTDTDRHRRAGACEVMLASCARWALMREHRSGAPPSLDTLAGSLSAADLVLVEGFRQERHPKCEVFRASLGKRPLALHDSSIRFVVSKSAVGGVSVPVLSPDNMDEIKRLVLRECALAAP